MHGSRTQGHVREESRANGDIHQIGIAGKYTSYDHDSPKVPDDIDNRAAYGRRQSPDFGFPGARIKLDTTSKTHEASLAPGDWTKLGCGRFSNMPKSEIDSNLFNKPCRRRCSAKYMTRDGRNDDLFHDLSHTIDTIVEEHTYTLQGIINDIKRGQAGQLKDQEMSHDLAPSKHDLSQRPLDYQMAHLQVHDYPKEPTEGGRAEEVAAESTKRDVPGMDDSKRSLERSIRSFQDLYDLVNAAADDLGLDLDKRPNNEDDEAFRRAPVQEVTPIPVHQTLTEAMETIGADNALQSHNGRSETVCHHFSELYATRIQVMDEFGSIIEDISVQKPRVFKVKLAQSELPTDNDDGILTLQIRRCSSIQVPRDDPNRRSSCEQLSSKPSPGSHPTYTATGSPPPTELSDDLSPMSERKDGHGLSGTKLTRRTVGKPESSSSSSYATPCEYKERLVGFKGSLIGAASASTDLSTKVPQMTRSGSEYASSIPRETDDHGTAPSILSFRYHTHTDL
jgi:hypothetical protein